MENEPMPQIPSLVNTRSNESEISVTRIRVVDIEAVKQKRLEAVESMTNARATSASQAKITRESLEKVVSELEAYVQSVQRNLNFHIDEETGRVIVSVVDSTNNSIIRQIPSEEMLALSHRLQQYIEDHDIPLKGMFLEINA